MKYEMIFGDERLFDGAPEECILAVRMPGGDPIFYLEKNKSELRGNVAILKYGFIKLAMRRIIKEPKQWTREDKKAGRLPEAGCRVDFCHKLNTNWRTGEIKYIDNQVAVIKADDIDRPFVYEFDRVEFKPIETPAEKAQRLEDEFVVAMLDAASQEQLMSAGFKSGVIAAYRKLKGGE